MKRPTLGLGLFIGSLCMHGVACRVICPVDLPYDGSTATVTPVLDLGVCDAATLEQDTDPGAAAVTLTSLQIDAYGDDLDGIDNWPAPSTAGCNRTDLPNGGVDSRLYLIESHLAGTLQLNAALQSSIERGDTVVELRLHKLAPGPDDGCLGVTLAITRSSEPLAPVVVHGYGQMANHVVRVALDDAIGLSIPVAKEQVTASSCIDGVCNDATLGMTLRRPRATLTLDAAHAAIPHGVLSGFVFYEDVDPAYVAAESAGLRVAFSEFVSAAHLSSATHAFLLAQGDDALDLHMDPDGTLSPCTGTGSFVDANAISAGFTFEGR